MILGSRVVRGPDWQWHYQDVGEGSVGTITSVSEFEEGIPLFRGLVKVYWDNGYHAGYRVGIGGNHDLRLLDSSPCGITFVGYTCDGCGTKPIHGMCWHCSDCQNFDLCTKCYMEDKHRLDHTFICNLNEDHSGKSVGTRSASQKYHSKGICIYPGATVKPIDHNVQLGTGVVIELSQSDVETTNYGKCAVCWDEMADVSVHNLGYKGQVELKLIDSVNGPMYYRDHLPLVEMDEEKFYVGEKVCIHRLKSVEALAKISRSQIAGEIGTISKINSNGEVFVEFKVLEGHVWCFTDTSILSKVPKLWTGDVVRLTDNIDILKKLQTDHHIGFREEMKRDVNKVGKVLGFEFKGIVVVSFPNHVLRINPAVLQHETETAMADQVVEEGISKVVGEETASNFMGLMKKVESDCDDFCKSLFQNFHEKTADMVADRLRNTFAERCQVDEPDRRQMNEKDEPDSSEVYKMKSNPRGIAVIINIHRFTIDSSLPHQEQLKNDLREREGSDEDVDELNDVFGRCLNFKVKTIVDKPRYEILKALREIADNTANSAYDCLAVCIMSHCKEDFFYAADGREIIVSTVYKMFANSHCEVFRHKPKLFFIQACRGKKGEGFDVDGPTEVERSTTQALPESKDHDMADMLIAFSSFEGYTSYRHPGEGSLFIQSLVEVFREYADKEHISEMLIKVNAKVHSAIHGS